MDATVRAPGSTAAHSAAAYASQWVSCSRHGRPRSRWLTITARLAAAPVSYTHLTLPTICSV
eukprot:14807601-Alexandrium_andersonii.AAC.1